MTPVSRPARAAIRREDTSEGKLVVVIQVLGEGAQVEEKAAESGERVMGRFPGSVGQ
jgi:hypothetical protein